MFFGYNLRKSNCKKMKTNQVLCVPFVFMVKCSSRLWNEKQKMFFHIEFRTCIQKKKQCSMESSWATQLVFRPVGTIYHFFFSKCFAQIWKICLQGAPLPGGLAKCSKPARKKRKATKKAKKISYSHFLLLQHIIATLGDPMISETEVKWSTGVLLSSFCSSLLQY